MRRILAMVTAGAALVLGAAGGTSAEGATPPVQLRPDQAAFRELYRELVEINTTYSAGDCTRAAEAMTARLRAGGYPEADAHVFTDPGFPREGGLVAILHGSDPKAKAVLLLAHIDVVEAKRADWTRDPFKLVEENGYFYGRGASDDKAMASVFTDAMIRYREQGFRPRRDIKLALTCGEETEGSFNGASWLVRTHRDWIDAGLALNEGAGGRLDAAGNRVMLGIQAGEKVYQDFTLETTNPGGHSSRPVPDNAIYRLAAGLGRLAAYDFPVRFNDATRLYFQRMSKITGGESGAAMAALVADPTDAKAEAIVSRDPSWHSMLRTTCVATELSGGHAPNALPQRARANINCRVFPGQPIAEVQAKLVELLNDPKITVTPVPPLGQPTPVPPLTPEVLGPVEIVAGRMWPGTPIVPTMSTGASDGIYTNRAGIPTYGLSGMFGDPDGGGVHGLNERIRVRSLYEGRDFLFEVVKLYADQK